MIKINQNNVGKKIMQFNLEHLTCERANIIGVGWENIKIDPEFKEKAIDEIVELLGGRQATKDRIRFVIKNTPVHAWFASRIYFNASRQRWEYIAGQDYPREITEIRNQLKK